MNSENLSRSGMVAVVGRTNVGKSSLLNYMLDEKISIVSNVVQTTRNLVRGILTEERGQIAFLDTPGMHQAKADLGKLMNKIARSSIEGVDVIMLVVDSSIRPKVEDDGWMRRLAKLEDPIPVFIVLNKTDIQPSRDAEYKKMWDEVATEKESTLEPTWIKTSALNGKGTDELLGKLFLQMPVGPQLFPEDIVSDFPRKLLISDIIREKFFMRLDEELPHAIAVWIDVIEESDEKWVARGNIYVNRNSQKGIVIGKKGRLLKWVKEKAREDLKEIYEINVELDLLVKVEKNWQQNFWILRKLGYA